VAREAVLLAAVSDALNRFGPCVDTVAKDAIDAAQRALSFLRRIRDDHGNINEGKLQDAFSDLEQSGMSLSELHSLSN
jgi:hypothetical protein